MNTNLYKYLEIELNKKLDISDDAVWKYINDMNASCEKTLEKHTNNGRKT